MKTCIPKFRHGKISRKVLPFFFGFIFLSSGFLFGNQTSAFTREPDTDPAPEPLTITFDTAEDVSANCTTDFIGLSIVGDAIDHLPPMQPIDSPLNIFTFSCDETVQNDANDTPSVCNFPLGVNEILVLCSDSGLTASQDWQAYQVSTSTFEWIEGEAPTSSPSSTAFDSSAALDSLQVIALGISLLVFVVFFYLGICAIYES